MLAVVIMLFGGIVLTSCENEETDTQRGTLLINFHCASLAEGKQLLFENSEYYGNLTQNDIDWRVRKTGATLDELQAL